jgi:hypothetical protein
MSLQVKKYRYLTKKMTLDIDGMLEDLNAAPQGATFVLRELPSFSHTLSLFLLTRTQRAQEAFTPRALISPPLSTGFGENLRNMIVCVALFSAVKRIFVTLIFRAATCMMLPKL